MPLKVHFNLLDFGEFTDEFYSLLDPEIELSIGKEIPDPADFEILVHPTPTREWVVASQKLKAIIIPWAGVPEQTLNVLIDFPYIRLHNLHHNSDNTAELGFALLMAAAKRLIPLDQALRKEDWRPRYEAPRAILLKGRQALILGYGEIGKALAKYCLAFGMRVTALRKNPDSANNNPEIKILSIDKLHEVLPISDVMMIALPLTLETRDLINEEEINLMPHGGIIINIGRGPIINQHALYKALLNGHLRAAGSDVWYNYPDTVQSRENTPPADFPFGDLDNFVLSPHRGGLVENVELQRAHALVDMLNTANKGVDMPNKVDLNKGY